MRVAVDFGSAVVADTAYLLVGTGAPLAASAFAFKTFRHASSCIVYYNANCWELGGAGCCS